MPITIEQQSKSANRSQYAEQILMLGDRMFARALLRIAIVRILLVSGICALATVLVFPNDPGLAVMFMAAGAAYVTFEVRVVMLKVSIARRVIYE